MINNFFFSKIVSVMRYVEKYGRSGQATGDNIIWRMRFACWINKAKDTHSKYVILIAFPQQQWLRERASILRCTYIDCLVGRTNFWPYHCKWICSLLEVDVSVLLMIFQAQMAFKNSLWSSKNKYSLRYSFQKQRQSFISWWIKVIREKPVLRNEALKVLLRFSASCLCEAGFQHLSKLRSWLQPEHEWTCCLSF
jgi:hypothetical protein